MTWTTVVTAAACTVARTVLFVCNNNFPYNIHTVRAYMFAECTVCDAITCSCAALNEGPPGPRSSLTRDHNHVYALNPFSTTPYVSYRLACSDMYFPKYNDLMCSIWKRTRQSFCMYVYAIIGVRLAYELATSIRTVLYTEIFSTQRSNVGDVGMVATS